MNTTKNETKHTPRSTSLRVTDIATGSRVAGVTVQRIPRIYCASADGPGTKGRWLAGWQLSTPDGEQRFRDENWAGFVPYVRAVMENYGWEAVIS